MCLSMYTPRADLHRSSTWLSCACWHSPGGDVSSRGQWGLWVGLRGLSQGMSQFLPSLLEACLQDSPLWPSLYPAQPVADPAGAGL